MNWARPQISRRTGHESAKKGHNRLVSIILATKSSRGESIAFHYPAETDSRVLNPMDASTLEADTESDVDEEFLVPLTKPEVFDRRNDGHLPTIQERETSQDEAEDSWVAPWRTILGLDASLLADILTPQMSDHKFEMWIDNLVFLGCPVQLKSPSRWDDNRTDGMTDDKIHRDKSNGAPMTSITHTIDGKRPPAAAKQAGDFQAQSTSTSVMTTFHIVFAMDASVDDSYQKQISDLYQHVVYQLTEALTYEQVQVDYVWQQCEAMRALQRTGEKNRTNMTTLWHEILDKCNLAQVIKETFDALSTDGIAHLMINGQRPLSLYVPRSMTSDSIPSDSTIQHLFLNSAVSFGINMDECDPIILPYYALLLLDDPERILTALPVPVSLQLKDLLHEISPGKDFHALSESLRMPVQKVITMAQDLIRWRCALPIPPLHERNIYTISPTADKSRLPQHIQMFVRTFPGCPSLPDMLAQLSLNALPYANLIPEGRLHDYMGMLAWLMRFGWLIQLRTFVSIKVRAEIKTAVAEQQTEGNNATTTTPWKDEQYHSQNGLGDSVIADPFNANEQEIMWLEKMASYHPVADAALFLRACKYFNGKHAVEKIAVREGIDPKSLRRLLDVFDEDLIKCYSW